MTRRGISLYLDTSVVVSSLTNERRSSAVRAWLDRQDGELCISDWVATECAAALAAKVRTREISASDQVSLQVRFEMVRQTSLRTLAFQTAFFDVAAKAAALPHPALRAGDALHIAICLHHLLALCTLDTEQAKAAQMLGLEVHLL